MTATVTTWRPPATSTASWRRTDNQREQAVELLLVAGCDDWTAGDAETALWLLGQMTGRTREQLVEIVEELLDLADRVVESENCTLAAHAVAIDDYEAALMIAAAAVDVESMLPVVDETPLAMVNGRIRDELAERRSR